MTNEQIRQRMIADLAAHGLTPYKWSRMRENRPDVFAGIIGLNYAYEIMKGNFEGREKQLQLMRIFYGAFEPLKIDQQVKQFETKYKKH